MTAAPPRRPWWRRKWTLARTLALLAAEYPVSLGPVNYAEARGRVSRPVAIAYLGPYGEGVWLSEKYPRWCHDAGEHAASD